MKIIALGGNYVKHIEEMQLRRGERPAVFLMPDSALLKDGKPFFYPDFSKNIEYETEVVVRIHRLGKNIAAKFAPRYYDALTVGIDFTARDLQAAARSIGEPWALSKAFDNAAAIGEFIPKEELGDINELPFHLTINGNKVQSGNTKDMICNIDNIIEYVSKYFTLKIGDLIYTGTPVGVGAVNIGDHLEGFLGERKVLDCNIR